MTTIRHSLPRPGEWRSPDRYLTEDEHVVLATHHHLGRLIRPAALAAIAVLVAIIGGLLFGPTVSAFLWLLTMPFVIWLVWRLIEWRFECIFLTNRRIIYVTGIFIRKVAMMPFSKVTDLGYTRSLLGRLLGYGAVRLETAGQVQDLEHIKYLPEPDEFYRTLSKLVLK